MSLVVRETNVDNRFVWKLTKRTGLRFATVRNLLVNGWTYEEKLDKPARWISPLARLESIKPDA